MRLARSNIETSFFHIMVQGDEKKYVFENEKNKRRFIYLIKHNAFRNDVELIAYCIMDNHAHLLLFCPDVTRISKMMSECNTSFGLFFNKKRKKIGHVFRERFRSEGIYTRTHLIHCIKYIHENPMKAHICESCGQYIFSSYNEFYRIDERLMEICELSDYDIDEIILNPDTDTVFMDDEYSKDAINTVMNNYFKGLTPNLDDEQIIVELYKEIKEKCRATNIQIAEAMGISRHKLYKLLKKLGVK